MPKFLIVRFSSIGDIVLTSPVIRSLKKQIPGAEIHYLTRTGFSKVLEFNPYIDRLWCTDGSLEDVIPDLKKENYDFIFDLHHNLRSLKLKLILRRPSRSFQKLNLRKWLRVQLKSGWLPPVHIVDRYLETAKHLNLKNDGAGLDFYTGPVANSFFEKLPFRTDQSFRVLVAGARHFTKQIPFSLWEGIVKQLNEPAVILGGKEDYERAEAIRLLSPECIFNLCGQCSLGESAAIIQRSSVVITPDTGLMHIAAAFHKPIVSVWGNTIPDFGMYPYMPGEEHKVALVEVSELPCRPCSKIGYSACPKKHFRCMLDIDPVEIERQALAVRQ